MNAASINFQTMSRIDVYKYILNHEKWLGIYICKSYYSV